MARPERALAVREQEVFLFGLATEHLLPALGLPRVEDLSEHRVNRHQPGLLRLERLLPLQPRAE